MDILVNNAGCVFPAEKIASLVALSIEPAHHSSQAELWKRAKTDAHLGCVHSRQDARA
jgi:hypothetical protein